MVIIIIIIIIIITISIITNHLLSILPLLDWLYTVVPPKQIEPCFQDDININGDSFMIISSICGLHIY